MNKDQADDRTYAAYSEGFNDAVNAVIEILQLARGGEIDQDFRSIIFRVNQLSPDTDE